MFERTKNRDEEHVDERAHKFFSYMYGGDGCSYRWDSTKEGIRPTSMLSDGCTPICAYCGRYGLPIQGVHHNMSRGGDREYYSKGNCCVCKEAMDEVEMLDQLKVIEDQFKKARAAVYKAMPKTNPGLLEGFVDKKMEQIKKDLAFWNSFGQNISTTGLDKAGLKLTGPRFGDEEDYE